MPARCRLELAASFRTRIDVTFIELLDRKLQCGVEGTRGATLVEAERVDEPRMAKQLATSSS